MKKNYSKKEKKNNNFVLYYYFTNKHLYLRIYSFKKKNFIFSCSTNEKKIFYKIKNLKKKINSFFSIEILCKYLYIKCLNRNIKNFLIAKNKNIGKTKYLNLFFSKKKMI
ncbi:hypothetical protein [Candidatus Vidania fulgoroideorum]